MAIAIPTPDPAVPALAIERVDLAEVARAAAVAQRAAANARRVGLEVAVLGVPAVHGDAALLREVLDSLVSNAVKYSPGGFVEIEVREEGGSCVVEVRDDGIGIAEQDIPFVAERAHRSSPAIAGGLDDAAIGLAATKAVVEAHGGELKIESRLGRGTTVRVTLPRA